MKFDFQDGVDRQEIEDIRREVCKTLREFIDSKHSFTSLVGVLANYDSFYTELLRIANKYQPQTLAALAAANELIFCDESVINLIDELSQKTSIKNISCILDGVLDARGRNQSSFFSTSIPVFRYCVEFNNGQVLAWSRDDTQRRHFVEESYDAGIARFKEQVTAMPKSRGYSDDSEVESYEEVDTRESSRSSSVASRP